MMLASSTVCTALAYAFYLYISDSCFLPVHYRLLQRADCMQTMLCLHMLSGNVCRSEVLCWELPKVYTQSVTHRQEGMLARH